MRINLYVASSTGLSRRTADKMIADGKVNINQRVAQVGDQVTANDVVKLNAKPLTLNANTQTIMLNKPVGYVCSRDGQGNRTIYDLLPAGLHKLKPVGRLDKDSSGLLLLTNDGQLANQLTHPSFRKDKVYQVELNKTLHSEDLQKIVNNKVDIGDKRLSGFQLVPSNELRVASGKNSQTSHSSLATKWRATLAEGRNRQIRRTFEALGYKVTKLHRTQFGDYKIGAITEGKHLLIK